RRAFGRQINIGRDVHNRVSINSSCAIIWKRSTGTKRLPHPRFHRRLSKKRRRNISKRTPGLLVNNHKNARARRRLPAVFAQRTRPISKYAKNLRGSSGPIRRLGARAQARQLAGGRVQALDRVPAVRTRTRRFESRRKSGAKTFVGKCLSANCGVARLLSLCRK